MREALEAVTRIVAKCNEEVVGKFRARARNEASNIYYTGFAPSLAVIASRSNAKALELGLTSLSHESFLTMICESDKPKNLGLTRDEEIAYALYGGTLLYILKKLGAIKASSFEDLILNESKANPLIDSIANEVALWLKRFAEALIMRS